MDPRNFRPDLIDSLGIVDFALRREYGRDRGMINIYTALHYI